MAKAWRCWECGEIISYGEICACGDNSEVPEEFLTPQQITQRDYEGTYDD